jgi:hypothetical protein
MIVRIRLSGDTQDDIKVMAVVIGLIPGVETDQLQVNRNYRSPGYRGYLTAVVRGSATEFLSENSLGNSGEGPGNVGPPFRVGIETVNRKEIRR